MMKQEHRSCQCEDKPCCGCDNGVFEVEEFPYPGDDTMEDLFGEDDLADYNQNEADDYRDEGYEDSWLGSYEE